MLSLEGHREHHCQPQHYHHFLTKIWRLSLMPLTAPWPQALLQALLRALLQALLQALLRALLRALL